MRSVINIFSTIYKLVLLKLSDERRNKYLRRQGVKIGKDAESTQFLFNRALPGRNGDHARIASGTMFITHDGAVNCFPAK